MISTLVLVVPWYWFWKYIQKGKVGTLERLERLERWRAGEHNTTRILKGRKDNKMSKKPGIPYERHAEIGALLRQISHDITMLAVEFGNAYAISGKRGAARKALAKAEKALFSARSAAEENYFAEYPDIASLRVYMGQPNGEDSIRDKMRNAEIQKGIEALAKRPK